MHHLKIPRLPKPIEDRSEYERQMHALPAEESALVDDLTRYADICRFFAEKGIQVPPHIQREVADLRSSPLAERTERMGKVNRELMEYLDSVTEDSQLRM